MNPINLLRRPVAVWFAMALVPFHATQITAQNLPSQETSTVPSEALPMVAGVAVQPLVAHTRRLIEAADSLIPFTPEEKQTLESVFQKADNVDSAEAIQRVLDAHCLLGITINPESRVKVARGPAKPELIQNGWRHFLVKVHNQAGVISACCGSKNRYRPEAVPHGTGRRSALIRCVGRKSRERFAVRPIPVGDSK